MPHDPASRPSVHLAPRAGWLNDPNGMTYRDGRWHVFHQHNPAGPFHSAIAWAHTSSDDLVHWREHAVAFSPTPGGPDEFGCWSGVFIEGLDRPAVVYSGVVDRTAASTVCLRWGSDDLDTWSEPVVVARTPDDVVVMRDPFVFTVGGRRWAILGAELAGGPALLLFSCEDILDWRYEGLFLSTADPVAATTRHADIWECPQLVLDGDRALLLLSIWHDEVLDGVQIVTGCVVTEEGRPRFEAATVLEADLGNAFYAPQVALDERGPWLLGWVREEGYPDFETDGSPQTAGCMTFVRRLHWPAAGPPAWVLDEARCRATGASTDAGTSLVVEAPSRVVATGAWRVRGDSVEAAGSDADLWFDGEVLEVYPHDRSTPSTYRDLGTARWQVTGDALTLSAPR